jgi:hypothetical protein
VPFFSQRANIFAASCTTSAVLTQINPGAILANGNIYNPATRNALIVFQLERTTRQIQKKLSREELEVGEGVSIG